MRYRFAELEFELNIQSAPVYEDEMTAPFVSCAPGAPDFYYYEVPFSPELISKQEKFEYDSGAELVKTEKGVFHINHWAMCRRAYGFFPAELSADTPVYTNPELKEQIPIASSYFLSTLGLHHKLLGKGAIVLHASYIDVEGRAILFLGPSGTGKTTQAELWKKHANACIVNGDRALLRKMDGRWMVYGYPCCGSSSICLNRTLPLAAIVILRQGREDTIEEVSPARRVSALMAATEIYPWQPWEVEQALLLAQEVCSDVPIVQYSCTKEPSAVTTLKSRLEKLI